LPHAQRALASRERQPLLAVSADTNAA